jgi:rifampicin phosphotransferase
MSTTDTLLPWSTPMDAVTERQAGGKGWNLFRLVRCGVSVPPWLIVGSALFDAVIASHRDEITGIMGRILFTDRDSLEEGSSRIRALVLGLEIPEPVRLSLRESMLALFGNKATFSVRSSIVGEDSVKHSFAGQMDSFLNVPAGGVEDAVKKVWASAFSVRALVYRQRKNIGFGDISAAVIVQEMIHSRTSGVLFTNDPRSGEERCVIAAGFGVGEGVVASKVETDTYTVTRDLTPVAMDVPVKERRMAIDASGGLRMEALPPDWQCRQVLSHDQVRELARVGVQVEQRFGCPQDIEWAYDEQDRLFLLQARPIVLPEAARSGGTVRIWDNSNIVEGYPGITLPLTFSFIRNSYEHLFRNATLGFILQEKDIRKDLPIFKSMVGLVNGRVYYNLLNWYRMMSYLPGYEQYKKSWDEMIGIHEGINFPSAGVSLVNRAYGFAVLIFRLLTARSNAKEFYSLYDRLYGKYGGMDLRSSDEEALMSTYESLEKELLQKWHLTLYNDFCAIKYYGWLKRLCERWGLAAEPNLYNDLLCGERGVESVAVVHALVRIAEMFQADADLRALLDSKSDREVWEIVSGGRASPAVRAALDDYLLRFGDRASEELKLEKPSYREEPAALIGLIRNYGALGLTVEKMKTQNRVIRCEAEETARRRLKTSWRQIPFGFVLRNARYAIVSRENMRFRRSRIFGVARRLFNRMGDLWAEKGIIESPRDIFYLTVEEIFGFCRGTSVNQNPRRLVEIRKAEYDRFDRYPAADRFRTEGIPYLCEAHEPEAWHRTGNMLRGVGCVSGIAEGTAKVVLSPAEQTGGADTILVARSTDPGWVFLMVMSRGMVVERGSLLSHTAIIGRELGIPTIVGVKDATKRIPDGARVVLDGGKGEIHWQ